MGKIELILDKLKNMGSLSKRKPKEIEKHAARENSQDDLIFWPVLFAVTPTVPLFFGIVWMFESERSWLPGALVSSCCLALIVVSFVQAQSKKILVKNFFRSLIFICMATTMIVLGIWVIMTKTGDIRLLGGFLCALGLCFACCAVSEVEEGNSIIIEEEHILAGDIEFPLQKKDYQNADYKEVFEKLYDAGFRNIRLVNLRDLRRTNSRKKGKVSRIIVFGEDVIYGEWYHKNAEVVITYHDSKKDE